MTNILMFKKKEIVSRIMKCLDEFWHPFCRRLLRPAYVTVLKIDDKTQMSKPPEHAANLKKILGQF